MLVMRVVGPIARMIIHLKQTQFRFSDLMLFWRTDVGVFSRAVVMCVYNLPLTALTNPSRFMSEFQKCE